MTWNTQGKNPTAFFFAKEQQFTKFASGFLPDYICIQEAGTGTWNNPQLSAPTAWVPRSQSNPNGVYKIITDYAIGSASKHYNGYEIPWQVSDSVPNARCSMAILWRSDMGDHTQFPLNGWWDQNPAHRPVFWISHPNVRIGCIHAPAGGNVNYIQQGVTAISAGGGNWTLAGDFNVAPGVLGGHLPHGVTMLCPNTQPNTPVKLVNTQHSGNTLDYLLSGGNALYHTSEAAETYVNSDHLQVRFG